MALAVVRFDLRRSPSSTVDHPTLYSTALEMAAYADEHGYDMLGLSEHHGDPGGYLASPLVVAGAFAGCTSRMPMIISALLIPMHDPIRLAEDIAALDLVSGGRVWIVTGIPTAWMYVMSTWALVAMTWPKFTSEGQFAMSRDPVAWAGVVLVVLAALMLVEAIWIVIGSGAPPARGREALAPQPAA